MKLTCAYLVDTGHAAAPPAPVGGPGGDDAGSTAPAARSRLKLQAAAGRWRRTGEASSAKRIGMHATVHEPGQGANGAAESVAKSQRCTIEERRFLSVITNLAISTKSSLDPSARSQLTVKTSTPSFIWKKW
jgi:hypothetical protein